MTLLEIMFALTIILLMLSVIAIELGNFTKNKTEIIIGKILLTLVIVVLLFCLIPIFYIKLLI